MPNSTLKAVTFDAAGTLIHLAEPVGTVYARISAEHGFSVEPHAITQAFHDVWARTPLPFSPGAGHHSDEREWWRQLVHAIYADAGCPIPPGERFDAFFDALYLHYEKPGAWLALPDAHEVLQRVSQGYRCAILSNFDSRLRHILRDLELLPFFETLFLSGEQKLSKPDPRLFQRVTETLALSPAEILHVGDDPRCDWQGAESAGFQTFRVGPDQNQLRGLLDKLSLA